MERESLAELATELLQQVKYGFLLRAQPEGDTADVVTYRPFNDVANLAPGKANGQDAPNGYFLAPHVLTSKNSAGMIKEFGGLQRALAKDLSKAYQLKRSFSPQTSKINAGTKSMSDPKDDLLVAAYTAIGAATSHKAAALDFGSFSNIALIPDIPLYRASTGRYPLLDYIQIISLIQTNLGDAYLGKYDPDKKKYGARPPIYRGNFRYALNNVNFGSLQLLAAFSGMITRGEEIDQQLLTDLIDELAGRPLMIIGYDHNGQEQFGTHLTNLIINGMLYRALEEVWKIELTGIESGKKFSSPNWSHLKRNLDRWLRRFDAPSFRGFLSVRATYPTTFLPFFHQYFIMQQIPRAIVDAAMDMGKSLNRAAYRAGVAKAEEDKREQSRDKYEYKARVLSSLEGNIRSAKTPSQLFSQVSTLVGRLTNHDISNDATPFVRAALEGQIELSVAQDLLITFMRLNQTGKTTAGNGADDDTAETETAETESFTID